MGHASQKLLGWFGGGGMQPWIATVQRAGFQPAVVWAYLQVGAEMGAGLLLVLGLLTPVAAAVLIGDMLVAILKVHAPRGLWSQDGGFEYNLVLIAVMVFVGMVGAGRYSVDRHLPVALPRPYTFLIVLVLTLALIAVGVAPTLGAQSGGP
jgi:putative oxidoreductase